MPADLRNKVQEHISKRIVGKEEEIDAILLAILTKNHMLLIGKPGTAKTMLIQEMSKIFNFNVFMYQLTKFTEYSEIFGPLNLKKYKEGEIERFSKIQTADIVFLDEILKGNSAILNSMLTLLRERKIFDGYKEYNCNLISCIGTTNEEMFSKEYEAFIDRFIIKKKTKYIDNELIEVAIIKKYSNQEASELKIEKEWLIEVSEKLKEKTLENIRNSSFIDRIKSMVSNIKKESFISDRTILELPMLITTLEEITNKSSKEVDSTIIEWMYPKEYLKISEYLIDQRLKTAIEMIENISKQYKRNKETDSLEINRLRDIVLELQQKDLISIEKNILKDISTQLEYLSKSKVEMEQLL